MFILRISPLALPRRYWRAALFALVCLIALTSTASAQTTYTLIHRFKSGARAPIGRLVEAPDGSLYGITYAGGEPGALNGQGGTAFALHPLPDGSWSFETVHEFEPSRDGGDNPSGRAAGA